MESNLLSQIRKAGRQRNPHNLPVSDPSKTNVFSNQLESVVEAVLRRAGDLPTQVTIDWLHCANTIVADVNNQINPDSIPVRQYNNIEDTNPEIPGILLLYGLSAQYLRLNGDQERANTMQSNYEKQVATVAAKIPIKPKISENSPPPPPPPGSKNRPLGTNIVSPPSAAPPNGPPVPPKMGIPLWKTKREEQECKKLEQEKALMDWQVKPGKLDDQIWTTIDGFRRSSSGSAGIFFVNRPTGTVVIKGTQSIVPEYFSTQLAHHMGIKAPQTRLVDYSEKTEEWHMLKSNLIPWVEAKIGIPEALKVAKELDRPQFLVMDVFIGKNFNVLEKDTMEELFGTGNNKGLNRMWSTRRRLRELGELVAFDILCNNWDRIPILWQNTGNFENIFIEMADENCHLVAIDNTITTVFSGTERNAYFIKVTEYLKDLTENPNSEHPKTENVRKEILRITNSDIGEEGSIQLQFGILQGISKISKKFSENIFLKYYEQLQKCIQHDWEGVWGSAVERVDIHFIVEVFLIMKKFEDLCDGILSKYHLGRDTLLLPCHIPPDHPYDNIKVLIIQWRGDFEQDPATNLDLTISAEIENSGRKPDFVVFPENFIKIPGSPDLKHPVLKNLGKISEKFKIYVVAGSMDEEDILTGKHYNSSVVLGPDGEVIGCYRKWYPVSGYYERGNKIGVYDSKFGKFGVIICFDAENSDCMSATLAEKPFIIFNPTCIPKTKGYTNLISARKTAMDMMKRNFEVVAWRNKVTFVRADLPIVAMGSSQVITPYATVYSPTHEPCHFFVNVDLTDENTFYGFNQPERDRTLQEDNTGNRYLLQSLKQEGATVATFCWLSKENQVQSGLAIGGKNGEINIYHLGNFQKIHSIQPNHQNSVQHLLPVILTGLPALFCVFFEKTDIHLYDVSSGTLLWNGKTGFLIFKIFNLNLQNSIICVCENGTLVGIGFDPKRKIFETRLRDGKVTAAACLGGLCLVAYEDGGLLICEVLEDNAKVLYTLNLPKTVTTITISETTLVCGDTEGTFQQWNFDVHKKFEPQLELSRNFSVEFTYLYLLANNFVLIAQPRKISLYNLISKRYHHTFLSSIAPLKYVYCNGDYIVGLDEIENVWVWTFLQDGHPIGLMNMMTEK